MQMDQGKPGMWKAWSLAAKAWSSLRTVSAVALQNTRRCC